MQSAPLASRLMAMFILAGCAGKDSAAPGGNVEAEGGSDAGGSYDCHAETVGTMPSSAQDVTYATVTAYGLLPAPLCQSDSASLIQGLLACAPVSGGYLWSFGSSSIQVDGIKGGHCVYDVALEEEMGGREYTCEAPLPVHAWEGLYFIDNHGRPQGSELIAGLTCTLLSNCGPTECLYPDGGVIPDGAPK